MRIVKHDRRPIIPRVRLRSNPLRVWLDQRTELIIRPGDRLGHVARRVRDELPFLNNWEARRLVAYWFALGERFHYERMGEPWMNHELLTSPTRRYLDID